MLEIVFLIVTTGGIAAYARGRGGNPWLWGTISVAGHLLIQFLVLALLQEEQRSRRQYGHFHRLLRLGRCGRAWHSIFAGERPGKAVGHMQLFNCKYLNQHYAVICEACSQPFRRSEAAAPKL
jgi:hypothetical protein